MFIKFDGKSIFLSKKNSKKSTVYVKTDKKLYCKVMNTKEIVGLLDEI